MCSVVTQTSGPARIYFWGLGMACSGALIRRGWTRTALGGACTRTSGLLNSLSRMTMRQEAMTL